MPSASASPRYVFASAPPTTTRCASALARARAATAAEPLALEGVPDEEDHAAIGADRVLLPKPAVPGTREAGDVDHRRNDLDPVRRHTVHADEVVADLLGHDCCAQIA